MSTPIDIPLTFSCLRAAWRAIGHDGKTILLVTGFLGGFILASATKLHFNQCSFGLVINHHHHADGPADLPTEEK